MSNLPKLGIDIGSASIKIVELVPSAKDKWKLITAASMASPEGGLLNAKANLDYFSQAIAKIIKEAGATTRQVVASLPEEQVSSHVVEMPVMTDAEIDQALQWQVDQYIPIPADQAIWSYQIIARNEAKNSMEVLLVATNKTLVETYKSVLEKAGLTVLSLETELMATVRATVPEQLPLSLVVDIGSQSTDIGVVSHGLLVFARTIPTAGEAFTRAIETTLGLDKTQAEQYKNTYGFSAAHLDGKLLEAMRPVLNVIVSEIRKTADFYISKHPAQIIKTVTLAGGIAALPDVVGVLSGQLGMEVVVGSPFTRVSLDENQTKLLSGNEPFYAVAVGLAMRET